MILLKEGGRYVFECRHELSEAERKDMMEYIEALKLKDELKVRSREDYFKVYKKTILKLKKLACYPKLSYTFRED